MKAILKSNRKVIVDVMPHPTIRIIPREDGGVECYMPAYFDKSSKIYYRPDELDFVEYYGG
jgi:hypothetical protein